MGDRTGVPARARLQIHCCVVLWGFTPILGKLISLPSGALVWWRMVLVTLSLCLLPRVWTAVRAMPPRLLATFGGVGLLVAVHWLTFYGAIRMANASVAASCLALCPVFIALIEPWVAGRRLDASQLWLGLAALPGVLMILRGTPDAMNAGVLVGVLSALVVAIFASWNKRLVNEADPLTVTFIEMSVGALALTLLAPVLAQLTGQSMFIWPSSRDAALLLVLGLACTLLPFALALVALRSLTAFEAQLAVNLEPVYTILLAILLFDEQRELDVWFYAGVAIVLGVVFIHPLLARRAADRGPGGSPAPH